MWELLGPYPISEIKFWVRENVPGIFIIGEETNKPIYIGSSETDIRRGIENVVRGRTNVWFEFFSSFSPVLLFRLKCKRYHDYDSLREIEHPRPPSELNQLKCHVSGCEYNRREESTHGYFS